MHSKKQYVKNYHVLCLGILAAYIINQLSDVYRMIHTWEHDSLGGYINIPLYKVEQSSYYVVFAAKSDLHEQKSHLKLE